uniref:Uncharacterized protein n=1 Tax=Arundo donax TaxID=35708 RepID=A0A0A8ZLP2_ARUDO
MTILLNDTQFTRARIVTVSKTYPFCCKGI